MPAEDRARTPFGEQGVLEELERLHRQIEESRRRRRDATDAFDTFLRSFGTRSAGQESGGPASGGGAANVRAQPRTSEPPAREPTRPSVRPSPNSQGLDVQPFFSGPGAPALSTTSEDGQPSEPVEPVALESAPRPTRSRRVAFVVTAAAVGAVALFMWRAMAPERSDAIPVGSVGGAAAPQSSAPAPDAVPAQKPAESRVPGAELTTVRLVWVRVLVDGKRVVERELEAGTRIPLEARQRIVIRTGDAGAVRLFVAGKDLGFLGREGEVVTRTFTVPPSLPR